MGQIRFHNYQRPLVSFDENMRALGFIHPGRICGFDTMAIVGGNTLGIAHTLTGVIPTLLDGTGGTKRGTVQSRQGNFIQEDAAINIDVDFNVGNLNDRIDLLIMQHSFIDSVGGAAAVYSIIKGVLTGAQEPALSDPLTQVLIGKFLIKAGAANHVNTIYEPTDPFSLGGVFSISKKSDRDVPDVSNLVNPGRVVAGAQVNSDLNRMTKSGLFRIITTTNRPTTFANEWFILVSAFGTFIVQMALSKDGKAYTRCSLDTGATWTAWQNLNNSDLSVGNLDYSSNNFVADFDSVTVAIGKLDAALKLDEDNLTAEATTRAAADVAVNTELDGEEVARAAADAVLDNKIGVLEFGTIHPGPTVGSGPHDITTIDLSVHTGTNIQIRINVSAHYNSIPGEGTWVEDILCFRSNGGNLVQIGAIQNLMNRTNGTSAPVISYSVVGMLLTVVGASAGIGLMSYGIRWQILAA